MITSAVASEFQASIQILDSSGESIGSPVDITNAISAYKISFSGLNTEGPNGYCYWTGEIFLESETIAANIDARDTSASPTGASLLAQGNAIDLQIFRNATFSRLWPTLYILRTPQPFDPLSWGDKTTRLEIGDITRLEATRQPEGNLSGMTLGTNTFRHTIANNILSARNLPTSTDTITDYPLSVPTQKLTTNDWGSEIGRLVGTAGYYFWIDSNDDARFTLIDLEKSAPDITLTIGVDEVDRDGWKRVNLAERPPTKLVVTGTGGRAISRTNPEVITDIRPEKEITYTRDISVGTNRVTETHEERLSERLILPRIPTQGTSGGQDIVTNYTENTSTTLRLAKRETIVSDYSALTKELRTKQIVLEIAKGMAGGDAFRDTDTISDAYDLLKVQQTTITYDYSDGRLSNSTTSTQRPWAVIPWANVRPNNYEVNRFLTQTNLTKTESWSKRLLVGQSWKYEFETQVPQGELTSYYGSGLNADVLRDDPDRTGVIESSEDGAARPPSTEYMPLLYEQDNQQYQGSITITPLAGQAHKNRERTVSVQGPYVVSNRQCEGSAEIIARVDHGNSLGQQFVGAIPSSLEPGMRVDVTDNGVTKSYLLNGFTITADSRQTLWGCSLAELGTVGVTPDVVTPSIAIAYPVEVFSAVPMPGVAAEITRVETISVSSAVPMPGVAINIAEPVDASVSSTVPMPGISINVIEPVDIQVSSAIPMPGVEISVVSPDPDADAHIARLGGTYSQAELDAINELFVDLKSAGVYTKTPALWLYCMDTSADASLNIISTSFTATPTNQTFTARQGFTGNGSTSFIGTGFTPSSEASVGQNNMAVSVYLRSRSAGAFNDFGGRAGSGQNSISWRLNAAGQTPLSTLNSSNIPVGITSTAITGMQTLSRVNSSTVNLYRNSASDGSLSLSSTGKPTVEMYVGATNSGGASGSSDGQYAMAAITEGFTPTEVADFHDAIIKCITVFGANV